MIFGSKDEFLTAMVIEFGFAFDDGFPGVWRMEVSEERFELGAKLLLPLEALVGGCAAEAHGEGGIFGESADVLVYLGGQ